MPTGKPTKQKPCVICGELFLPEKPSSKICNRIHYSKCPICGKQIEWNSTRNVEPCSKTCSKELTRRRNIEKYGCDHPMQNKTVQEHHKQSMMNKYEVEYPLQSEIIRTRAIETNREKFGSDWALGSKTIIEKSKQTMEKKYGGATTLQSPTLRERVRTTMIERYGNTNSMKVEQFKNKAKETNLLRYGVSNPMKDSDICMSAIKTRLEELGVKSSFEFYLNSRFFNLYIEKSKTLIEIDPTYTHSVIGNHWNPEGIDKCYHRDKSKIATESGYRCIHIFDWDDIDKVLQMLQPKERIYARKCKIYKLRKEVAEDFLNRYHLQGSCRGQLLCLGLVYEGDLIQVMTFGKSRYDKHHAIELLRLCTRPGLVVVGGASKLFSYATSEYGLNDIISYCDLSKFTGRVYEEIGMKKIRITPPQEVWSRESEKITANLLRARGYDQLFKTNFGKGTSNEDLMIEHGWLPVYDCGQAVYEFK